jgi:CotH kinase protein
MLGWMAVYVVACATKGSPSTGDGLVMDTGSHSTSASPSPSILASAPSTDTLTELIMTLAEGVGSSRPSDRTDATAVSPSFGESATTESASEAMSRDAGTASSGAISTDGAALGDPSLEIYDPERLPRFELELSPEAIETLSLVTGQDDPRQDEYVSATFHYAGETVFNVGVRIKGEGSFQQLDAKPAWKVKFDEFVPDQTFHGLRRMTLNNLFEDPSFLAERLAYDVYRAAGVPAPRCNSALVYINDEYYGVYANVEAEDKTFLRRWFDDVSGNLYEEGQSDFVPGAELAFNLETNEERNDRSDLINLIAAVSGATNPDSFLDDIGTYMDTRNYLRFTAVEAAVNQWDMYSYTVFWVNNLRLYSDPSTGKFHFIPWGHDMSMKPYRDSGKPYVHLFELARQYDRTDGDITSGLLLRRCLASQPCVSAYRAAVADIMAVYEGLDLGKRAAAYYAQIKPFVYEDNRKRVCCSSDSLSNEDFETAYASVLSTIEGRVPALQSDLDE